MVLEPGLARGHEFKPLLCNLHVCFPHLVSLLPKLQFYGIYPRAGMRLQVREGVKEHDIHIESKSYKLKFLGKLIVQQ